MIVRIWTGEALDENADDYRKHFHEVLMPKLRAIDGFINAEALERVVRNRIEFVIITRWDNLDAIRAFAGHHEERAAIEPDIRDGLVRFDEKARHFVQVAEEKK